MGWLERRERATGHRASYVPLDALMTDSGPCTQGPQFIPEVSSRLDDKDELISVALVNTGSVLVTLFHLPERLANIGRHYAYLLNCLLKLLRGDFQLLRPVSEFIIFVNIDPVAVSVILLRCVIGHSASCSSFVRVTDSSTLDT